MSTQEIYKLRDSFTIIGLTGRTGSGCTRFANIISKSIKFDNETMLRSPKEIKYIDTLPDNNTVFKRKYTICYNYIKANNKQYEKISYLSVLFLYCLHYGVHKLNYKTKDELIQYVLQLVKDNFKKSVSEVDDNYISAEITVDHIEELKIDFDKVVEKLLKLKDKIEETDKSILYDVFFESEVKNFTDKLFKMFAEKDYYLGSFFVHRLGSKIRATGNPLVDSNPDKLKEIADTKNIYLIVSIINLLIKAWRHAKSKKAYICIDSLRNSLEIMYLKERYAAFYMIAIHNDNRYRDRIIDRLVTKSPENKNNISEIADKIIRLDEIENRGDDFKAGRFYSPDVENCIQRSDIHINNIGSDEAKFDKNARQSSFYTMIEQWIKIQSLILHPGLITPTHDERCMQIAFISKFNSGCISRQVGAVITDENNSIRSVGWNDVPKGAVPCNLKDLNDIIDITRIHKDDLSYSPFEKGMSVKKYDGGDDFSSKSIESFKSSLLKSGNTFGLNHSYCFKSLHNRYEEKDNQVHTRSLHAEENAMLQVSKYGGQPLKNGTLYTTASPCELCAKKAYQLGLKIVYIDPYPGISMEHILANGYGYDEKKKANKPKMFTGIVGRAYNKLYEPLLSYKDELAILAPQQKVVKQKSEKEIKEFLEAILECELKDVIDLNRLKSQFEYLKKE